MADITVHICARGDPSVGIPSAYWSIDLGTVDIADVQEEFRDAIRAAFSMLADERVGVSFSFEREAEPAEPVAEGVERVQDCGCSDFELCVDRPGCKRPLPSRGA